jgi:hypothetical protein
MNFYSYLYLRDDTTPYYAGKGKGKRVFNTRSHRVHPPKDRSRILIFWHETETEAFESERAFIKWFGRKDLGTGCLRNMTDGGEGYSNPSDATRKKLSEASLKWHKKQRLLRMGIYPHNAKPKDRVPRQKTSELAEQSRKFWEVKFLKSVAWG